MSDLPKRFWIETSIEEGEGGFVIKLDERPLRTPAKALLLAPTAKLAHALQEEWNAIGEEIDPTQLRYTKLCNSAIDNIPQKRAETIGVLASYIETDLVCYRSESPAKLTDAQEALWSPLVDWFEKTRGVRLISTTGILPVEQPREAKDVTQAWLERLDNYALMAVHDLVIMSGSMVLAMAVVEREISAEDAWNRSILDEVSQEELWGTDAESISSRRSKSQDFDIAAQFYFSLIE